MRNRELGADEMERMPAVAGTFYPGDAGELRQMISEYLSAAKPETPSGKLRGIIVPHAGYIYSGPVAAWGYKLLQDPKLKIHDTGRILLLGPSHYSMFMGLAEGGFQSWRTPLGETGTFSIRGKGNQEIINTYPGAHEPEHSLEVQLPFLQHVLEGRKFAIDPVLTGEIAPGPAAAVLEQSAKDPFFVVSSDLSHYMPYGDAVAKDSKSIALMEALDVEGFAGRGDACGKTGIAAVMALARKKGWKIKKLHYANSGDTAGPKSEVVGYAALAILEGR